MYPIKHLWEPRVCIKRLQWAWGEKLARNILPSKKEQVSKKTNTNSVLVADEEEEEEAGEAEWEEIRK